MDKVISAFQSKTVWLLLLAGAGWVTDHYTSWNWFSHLDTNAQTLIVGVWSLLVAWARNQAAKSGDVISLAKTFGMTPKK